MLARVLALCAAAVIACSSSCKGLVIIQQLSSCSVKTDLGTVDLTGLSKQGGPPRFANVPSNAFPGEVSYDWNPCIDFSEAESATKNCQSVAMCAVLASDSPSAKIFVPYGNQASANFSAVGSNLVLGYTSATTATGAAIVLQCKPGEADLLVSTSDEDYTSITFLLTGPSSCFVVTPTLSSSVSVGTILCIALATSLVVYFAVGASIMKFVKRSDAFLPVPHSEFWKQLPNNVKEGFSYTVQVFKRRRPGYEQA